MRENKLLISLLILIPVIVMLLWFVESFMFPVEVKSVENQTFETSENFMFREERWFYPLRGFVVESESDKIPLGIAGQTYELNFGRIPVNSSTTKILNMNSNNFAKIEFYTSGNISPYVTLPKSFYMKTDEKEVKIIFKGSDAGNFTGTLLVRSVIPKNILAEKIMK